MAHHRHHHTDEHGHHTHARSKIAKSMAGHHHEGKVGKVMHEFKHHELHSGSKHGPKVHSRKQAIAIGLSEARKAGEHVKGKHGKHHHGKHHGKHHHHRKHK